VNFQPKKEYRYSYFSKIENLIICKKTLVEKGDHSAPPTLPYSYLDWKNKVRLIFLAGIFFYEGCKNHNTVFITFISGLLSPAGLQTHDMQGFAALKAVKGS